jgi:hypothetical protein
VVVAAVRYQCVECGCIQSERGDRTLSLEYRSSQRTPTRQTASLGPLRASVQRVHSSSETAHRYRGLNAGITMVLGGPLIPHLPSSEPPRSAAVSIDASFALSDWSCLGSICISSPMWWYFMATACSSL